LETLFLYYYSPTLPTTYTVIFDAIIYLSLLEFSGIVMLCIVRTIINSNDKVRNRCGIRSKEKYFRCVGKPLKLDDHANLQSDEGNSLIREELIEYDAR